MIGVLGGMGPESTAYTYMQMIRYCQERYGAKLDGDFPPILLYSMPIPDVVEQGADNIEILRLLEGGIAKLKSAGAMFSIIPCNTVQSFIPELRKKADILSIIEETLKEAEKTNIKNWGVLATEVTIGNGLYQKKFNDNALSIIEPDNANQAEVTLAIREILKGNKNERARERLMKVVLSLNQSGAEGILLACTDLPIVLSEKEVKLKTIDTADVIARAAVDYYRKLKDDRT